MRAQAATSGWPSSQAQVDRERLEQEIALLLQRLDVAEELDRLSGHIEEIRRVITARSPPAAGSIS